MFSYLESNMVLSFLEIIDIVIMSAVVGFIFKDIFKSPLSRYNPLTYYKKKFNFEDFKFAVMVTAPAIILHEFGHKFVAMLFGAVATFKAAYFFLGIGVLLKVLNTGFIFFVPAYVQWAGNVTHFQAAMIAFAGPAVNFLIFGGVSLYLKFGDVNKKHIPFLLLTKRINLFLGIFNMIPFKPFDGGHFFSHIWAAIFL